MGGGGGSGGGGPIGRVDDARLVPIKALNPYHGRWTIKARCTNKGDVRTYNNARGGGKMFSFDLLDKDGGEVRGRGWTLDSWLKDPNLPVLGMRFCTCFLCACVRTCMFPHAHATPCMRYLSLAILTSLRPPLRLAHSPTHRLPPTPPCHSPPDPRDSLERPSGPFLQHGAGQWQAAMEVLSGGLRLSAAGLQGDRARPGGRWLSLAGVLRVQTLRRAGGRSSRCFKPPPSRPAPHPRPAARWHLPAVQGKAAPSADPLVELPLPLCNLPRRPHPPPIRAAARQSVPSVQGQSAPSAYAPNAHLPPTALGIRHAQACPVCGG